VQEGATPPTHRENGNEADITNILGEEKRQMPILPPRTRTREEKKPEGSENTKHNAPRGPRENPMLRIGFTRHFQVEKGRYVVQFLYLVWKSVGKRVCSLRATVVIIGLWSSF
jgi:hypothetical protein